MLSSTRQGASVSAGAAIGVLLVGVGVGVLLAGASARWVVLAAIATVAMIGLVVLPSSTRVTIALGALLLIPADEILPLSGSVHGFFILGVASVLVAFTALQFRLRFPPRHAWAFLALCGANLTVLAVHHAKGELRAGLFWIAAALIVFWLSGEHGIAEDSTEAAQRALWMAGATTGALGLMEFAGLFRIADVLPFYEPSQDEFSRELGARAVGLSGHALRLGTLAMLASLVGLGRILAAGPKRLGAGSSALTAVCLAGLLASGARGAWLGLAAGTIALLLGGRLARAKGTVAYAAVGLATLATIVATTGLGVVVRERLTGSASAPLSIRQRTEALGAVFDGLREIPLLGVGPGAADEFVFRQGLVIPNLENEYLITLVGGGVLGLAALLLWLGASMVHGLKSIAHRGDPTPLALVVALGVNLATYNLASWSAGATVLAVVTWMANQVRTHASGTADGPPLAVRS